jgi:hypothetical protein
MTFKAGYARSQEATMEALSAIVGIVAIVVGLISFDVSAVLLGSDSRERSFDGERETFWTNS